MLKTESKYKKEKKFFRPKKVFGISARKSWQKNLTRTFNNTFHYSSFIVTAFRWGWFIFGEFSDQFYHVSTKEYLEDILTITMKFDETLSSSFV